MTGAQAIVTVLLLLIMINICKYFERYGQFKAGHVDKQTQLVYPWFILLASSVLYYPSSTFILHVFQITLNHYVDFTGTFSCGGKCLARIFRK
jgi:hypothetical protein